MGTSGGYGRIVLKLAEDVESEVTQAGTILVIRFKRPVDIPVEISVTPPPTISAPHAAIPMARRSVSRCHAG